MVANQGPGGPESLYAQLTSGDSGRITEVAKDIARVRSSLREAAETISTGARSATQTWRGNAASEFAATANDNTRSATGVSGRLGTVETTVNRAARLYGQVERAAEKAIRPWREATSSDEDELRTLAKRTVRDLTRIRATYESRLAALLPKKSGNFRNGWDDEGDADISGVGKNKPWIPQGLAHDGDNLLMTSYYKHDYDGDGHVDEQDAQKNRSRLTYVDQETGNEGKNVYLGGKGDEKPPTHSGGIATDGKHTWVTSSNGDIYVYDKQKLDDAGEGDKVPAEQVVNPKGNKKSSYVTYADGKLWVGEFTKTGNGRLLEYDVDHHGNPVGDPEVHSAPPRTQGVIVRDDEFVFSQSGRNTWNGNLVRQNRKDPSLRFPILLDGKDGHAVEELVEVDGDIVLGHESGGGEFDGPGPLPPWRPPWIDPDDEPELTKLEDEFNAGPIPAGKALGGKGYELDPSSLVAAAGRFDEAAAVLTSAASSVSGMQLVGRVLGDVPTAEAFASAVTRRIEAAGRSLRNGGESITGVADGLVSGADTYRRMEDEMSSTFDQLRTSMT